MVQVVTSCYTNTKTKKVSAVARQSQVLPPLSEGGSPPPTSTGKEDTRDVWSKGRGEGMERGNGESITTNAMTSRPTNSTKTNQYPAFIAYRRKEAYMHPHAEKRVCTPIKQPIRTHMSACTRDNKRCFVRTLGIDIGYAQVYMYSCRSAMHIVRTEQSMRGWIVCGSPWVLLCSTGWQPLPVTQFLDHCLSLPTDMLERVLFCLGY